MRFLGRNLIYRNYHIIRSFCYDLFSRNSTKIFRQKKKKQIPERYKYIVLCTIPYCFLEETEIFHPNTAKLCTFFEKKKIEIEGESKMNYERTSTAYNY